MPEINHPLKVFLYHAPADKDAVRDLYLRLIKDGVDAWLVKERLLPGQDWKHEIHQAVHEADVVVVCVSGQFCQDDFRQTEVQAAFESALGQIDGEIFMIPARLEECERPKSLEGWQAIDLFEEAGYEMLMRELQARADQTGAIIQRRESSLPDITTPGMQHEKSVPDDTPVEAMQEVVGVIDGHGILIEDPAVNLQGSALQRKRGRAMILALLGFAGMFMTALLGPSRIEKLYQPSLTTSPEPTQASASARDINSVAIAPLAAVPTFPPTVDVSNIVFLIDTSGSMQGGKIRSVTSAVSDFIVHLNERYLVSVIEFDTHVELRMSLSHDRAEAGQEVVSLTTDAVEKGSCLHDALYAGIQETALTPLAKDTRNIVIILTDIQIYHNDQPGSCSINLGYEVGDLAARYPVSIFAVLVGGDIPEYALKDWAAEMKGTTLNTANNKNDIASALRSIAEATGLKLNTKVSTSASTTAGPASRIFVPAGDFVFGDHWVYLDSFWIDKTEVTNAMYAGCVQADRCRPPRGNHSRTRDSYFGNPAYADYPVIFVSWEAARDYCSWAGGRLPTEAEWEKAARGIGGRKFPWGDADPAGTVGLVNYHSQDTTQVGSFPNGASPYGLLDMAGNVGEWVADWLSVEYYSNPPASNPLGPDSGQYRVWRGGSWANTTTEWISTYSRTGNLPTDTGAGLGFRCARNATP